MMKKNSLHLQTSWLTIHMYFQKISKPMKHCQPNLIGHVFIFNDIYTCILKIIEYKHKKNVKRPNIIHEHIIL